MKYVEEQDTNFTLIDRVDTLEDEILFISTEKLPQMIDNFR